MSNLPSNLPGKQFPPQKERELIRKFRENWGSSIVNYFGPREYRPASLWSKFYERAIIADDSI